jgi:DNA-binding NarL/FixJ family response regulator
VHAPFRAYDVRVILQDETLRVLCVGRHAFVSEHLGRFFGDLGLKTECAVGLEGAIESARNATPDVILCEYELLASFPLAAWERDELVSRTAVIGVSLSRRPNEAQPLDVNSVAGFLYLPTLDRDNALRIIRAAAASTRAQYKPAPPSTSVFRSRKNIQAL